MKIKLGYAIAITILIPFFLCNSGVIYQLFEDHRSVVLNSEGLSYMSEYTHDQESFSAMWLKEYQGDNIGIYTDLRGSNRLISQGEITEGLTNSSLLISENTIEGYIYLRWTNVIYKQLLTFGRTPIYIDIATYSHQFEGKAKLYSNSGSEIWK